MLHTLVQTIPEMAWLKDADGVYRACNFGCQRVFGAVEADVVGKTDYELFDREFADFVREHDRAAIAAGGPSINEEWVTYPDGHRELLETIKTPMRDADGELIGVLGIARNVTEHRALETTLRSTADFVSQHHASGCFDALVQFAARTFDVEYVHLALLEPEADRVRVVAAWADGARLEPGYVYALAGTPCENVLQKAHKCYAEHVQQLFPRDGDLQTLHAEAYIGEPVLDGRGEVVGLIMLVSRRPMAYSQTVEAGMRILAARAGAELVRQQAETSLRINEERHRRITSITSDFIFSCVRGADGLFRIDWCAGNAAAVFGYNSEQLMARGCWRGSVVADDLPVFDDNVTRLAAGEARDFTLRINHADGSLRWLRCYVRVEDDLQRNRLYGACQDVTAQHLAEAALRDSEARYRALFEGSGDGILVTRGELVVDCNQSAARIFRCRREDVVGRSILEFSPERQPDGMASAVTARQRIASALAGEQPIFEWRHQRSDGSLFDAEVNLTTARIGGEVHVIGTMRDITERKQAEARIEFLAHHDALTGLPNRVLLRDRFEHARAYCERNGSALAMLFIDLDNFKAVNDSLGHATGDELLQAVVQRLDQCVRDTDTVSRQGGDEFIVLLHDLPDHGTAERVAGEVLLRLGEPFHLGGHVLNSGGSIGIALYPADGRDFEALLQKADTAMYNAKAAGRNTYRFFAEAMNARVREHLQLQSHLHRALANAQFRLVYQPKFDIADGRVTGLEALLRWNDPELGEIAPARFVPVAEDCGLIMPIGAWVMEEACRQIAAWRGAGLAVPPVSVNLSALQFHRSSLVDNVAAVLAAAGVPPPLLELELTEAILLQDVEHTLETVRGLKNLGVRLSIDDFGTGYSSLAYLKRFAVDKLKIDQGFVRDIGCDPDDAAIVRAVIQLARSLRLGTIAEGVETEEQAAFLRAEGCEEVQGFLFGNPQAPAAIEGLLARC